MRAKLINTGLAALALALASPVTMAPAQEISSLYITPKFFYSFQKGDLSSAHAEGQSYLGGGDDDQNLGIGVSVGTDFAYYYDTPVRLELEYLYHTEGQFTKRNRYVPAGQEFKVRAHSFLINGFYDFHTETQYTPYVGLGLGMAYLKTKYNGYVGNARHSASSNDWNFAWNLGAGVAYNVSDTLALDLGYRYMDLGKGKVGSYNYGGLRGDPKVDLTSHTISLGLRFSGF